MDKLYLPKTICKALEEACEIWCQEASTQEPDHTSSELRNSCLWKGVMLTITPEQMGPHDTDWQAESHAVPGHVGLT